MIRSRRDSLTTSVLDWTQFLIMFCLLGMPICLPNVWAQHTPPKRDITHPHLRHGESKEHGKVGLPDAHHSFADAELWAERFDAPEREKWQKPAEVLALMEIQPGMTVADIGAGTGYFLGPLSTAVGPSGMVLGLDTEPAMVEFMTKRAEREGWANVKVHKVQPDNPGLVGGTIDRILIVNTWHHIDRRESYSRTLYEALSPNGMVLVVDFTHESSHGPPVEQRLPPEEVVAELQAGGLVAEILEESLPDQYMVIGHHP